MLSRRGLVAGLAGGLIPFSVAEPACSATVVGAPGRSKRDDFLALGLKPFGFNNYSLVTDIPYAIEGTAAARDAQLDYIQATGANLIRIALPCFSARQYPVVVHTGSMPATVSETNLHPRFIAAVDTVMDVLAARKLKALLCNFFGMSHLPVAQGETIAAAYGSTRSRTAVYAASFVRWLVDRYRDHPALGLVSLGNEYVSDETAGPTAVQLGAWFGFVADAARAIKPDLLVTANIQSPRVNPTSSRETVEDAIARFRVLYRDLDVYCLHIYNDFYNFVGINATMNPLTPNGYQNDFGYEGLPALVEGYADMARTDGKALIIGETGVSTANEMDDPASPDAGFLSDRRKWQVARDMAPADCVLWWNVQSRASAAAAGNQAAWYIDPQSPSLRAAQFAAVTTAMNTTRPAPKERLGGATAALREAVRPTHTIVCRDRAARRGVSLTTTAGHGSSEGYVMMTWIRLRQGLDASEVLSDMTGPGGRSGFQFAAAAAAGTTEVLVDGRTSSGISGSNVGQAPPLPVGEFVHIAVEMRSFDNNGVVSHGIVTWINGVFWRAQHTPHLPDGLPSGAVIHPFGNATRGVPMELQDYALFRTVRPRDIWDHMRGVVSPRSLLHVRALANGDIRDVSPLATALRINGVSVAAR